MKLILFLLKASWRIALAAAIVGGLSGAASVALMTVILRTMDDPQGSTLALAGLFAALCAVVLATRIVSKVLVAKLTQTSIVDLQMGLCRQILKSPVKHLEEIGSAKLITSVVGDVSMITHAMSALPQLVVNFVILIFGAVYLGWLSGALLTGALIFCVLSVLAYWYSARYADRHVDEARDRQDVLQKRIEELIDGVKELKMNHSRREEFVNSALLSAQTSARHSQYVGECLQDAAISAGRLLFFVAIGLLVFLWPRLIKTDAETLNGYVLTILYLMSPLEQIMTWLPSISWAVKSVEQIEKLGLMLNQNDPAASQPVRPIASWEQIELVGVTHAYPRHGRPRGFELGPLNLTLSPGEIVFLTGGNGSGKTTLAKLILGLYTPERGEIYLDGQRLTPENIESYRQLFSVVFDDGMVFDTLLGVAEADRDERAQQYLRQLELDHVLTIAGGTFSTTSLSRGQRKRLALLTAYLENRSIYLFDEWAADQDPTFRQVFYHRLLPELKQQGKTVIAITHDDRYFSCADRVLKLEEGQLVDAALPEHLEAELQTLSTPNSQG